MIEVKVEKLDGEVNQFEIDNHNFLKDCVIDNFRDLKYFNPCVVSVKLYDDNEPIVYVEKALELIFDSINYCFDTLWGVEDYMVSVIECSDFQEAYEKAKFIKTEPFLRGYRLL